MPSSLSRSEKVMYRDRLRTARYSALADAEGFAQICYQLEALGVRLLRKQETLGKYRDKLEEVAKNSLVLQGMPTEAPGLFKRFPALFEIVLKARNDNMHLGAYARHATRAAIELCIGLEEGLVNGKDMKITDVMVPDVITVNPSQPVAHARQLMLMHSFSFLPIYQDKKWHLLSELGVAQYLVESSSKEERKCRLGATIESASADGRLKLITLSSSDLLSLDSDVELALKSRGIREAHTLWLVVDGQSPDKLLGILSPFELM